MKKLLAIMTLMASTHSAFASNELSAELLETLIVNAGTVDLKGVGQEQSLASILARELARQTLVDAGQDVILVNVQSECQKFGGGLKGDYYNCSLTIGNGDYRATRDGYTGPELEGSRTFHFQTIRADEPPRSGVEPKHQLLGNLVTMTMAG